eukprot:6189046-Pleurochrysis_carterae.AAC.5
MRARVSCAGARPGGWPCRAVSAASRLPSAARTASFRDASSALARAASPRAFSLTAAARLALFSAAASKTNDAPVSRVLARRLRASILSRVASAARQANNSFETLASYSLSSTSVSCKAWRSAATISANLL